MGKKKAGGGNAGLGRALIKERLNAGRGNKRGDTWVTLSLASSTYHYTIITKVLDNISI